MNAPEANLERYEFVDLARGIAALVVLVGHFRLFYAAAPYDWPTADTVPLPLYSLLWPVYEHTQAAVQLFWVISGLVFAAAYVDKEGMRPREFFVHRFARLYPLHFATLILVALLQVASQSLHGQSQVYGNNDLSHFLLHLALASNWIDPNEYSFNAPIWSVSLEVLIYALFFVLVRFRRLSLLSYLLLAAFFFLVERLTYSKLAWCGALFFIGSASFELLHIARRLLGAWVAVAALGLLLGSIAATTVAVRAKIMTYPEIGLSYAVFPAIIFLLASLDVLSVKLPQLLRFFAPLTYSLYLLHIPVIVALKVLFPDLPDQGRWLGNPFALLAYIVTVTTLAYFTTKYFELPMQRLIRRRFAQRTNSAD